MDPYAYVAGDPETKTDPTGRCPLCLAIVGGAIVGAVFGVVGNVASTLIQDGINGKTPTWGQVGDAALRGGLFGAIIGAIAIPMAAIAPVCTATILCWGILSVVIPYEVAGISNGIADRIEQPVSTHSSETIRSQESRGGITLAPHIPDQSINVETHISGRGISIAPHNNSPSRWLVALARAFFSYRLSKAN